MELAFCGWKRITNIVQLRFGNSKDVQYRMILEILDNAIPLTLDIYTVLFREGNFEKYLPELFNIWCLFFRLKWKTTTKLL